MYVMTLTLNPAVVCNSTQYYVHIVIYNHISGVVIVGLDTTPASIKHLEMVGSHKNPPGECQPFHFHFYFLIEAMMPEAPRSETLILRSSIHSRSQIGLPKVGIQSYVYSRRQ